MLWMGLALARPYADEDDEEASQEDAEKSEAMRMMLQRTMAVKEDALRSNVLLPFCACIDHAPSATRKL